MNTNLFEAAAQVRATLEANIDAETGEINENWLKSSQLFERKAAACVAWLLEEDMAIHAASQYLGELREKLEIRSERYMRLRDYLADNMKAADITEIKGEHGLYKAKLYIDRDESVLLEAGAKFPPEYCMEPKPPLPSKTKIKAALKAGQAIAGARLIKRDRLQIQ